MDLSKRNVWHHACGEPPRDYSEVCLQHGVILTGYEEAWTRKIDELNAESIEDSHSAIGEGTLPWLAELECPEAKRKDLTRFCQEMQSGDVVILRSGLSKVMGVGIVELYVDSNQQFGDIDGWHVPLFRRVRWFWRPEQGPQIFENAFDRWVTTQRVSQAGEIWKWLLSLPEPRSADGALPVLGDAYVQSHVSIDDVADYLFDNGVASAAIQHLVEEIGELTRIAKWYWRAKIYPSEHETVAYLVVPMLRALGWTPQKMGIEWERIDLALFDSLPREKRSLRVVVEAKKMDDACLVAHKQAQGYVGPHTDRLILTDGLRYGIYEREAAGQFRPRAYLNLARMRDDYPMLGYSGAKEALRLMTPTALKNSA